MKLASVSLTDLKRMKVNSKVTKKKTWSKTTTENGVTKTIVTTTTEMKCRSVDIIQTLLSVILKEGKKLNHYMDAVYNFFTRQFYNLYVLGNHLGSSWQDAMKFISQLQSVAESTNNPKGGNNSKASRSNSATSFENKNHDNDQNRASSWTSWAGSVVNSFLDPVSSSLNALDRKKD